jgi:superfamily II DNA or RNA helicase
MAMVLARAPPIARITRLRPYQYRIVNAAVGTNALVVLPTGSGKTVIAAELVARSGRALFLVPTIMLVEQQATAIREWLSLQPNVAQMVVAEYHGGQTLPVTDFGVLVTTPKAFEVAQAKRGGRHTQEPAASLAWEHFDLVVFDEVYHVQQSMACCLSVLLIAVSLIVGAPCAQGPSISQAGHRSEK